ncbi:MAG: molybdopterin cofactor-binding domain-containing protein, partial [Myxococcota bacterium]
MPEAGLSRRSFLQVSGGAGVGLLLSFPLSLRGAEWAPADSTVAELNAWIRVDPRGEVHFRISEVEMGQGVFTAIPMILADELEVPWERVHAIQAPLDARFGTQQTGGSRSIRQGFEDFRRVAASAREMLIRAAAARWEVPPEQCSA